MDSNLNDIEVMCPQCGNEFEIDIRRFKLDEELICPKCNLIFTLRGTLIGSNKAITEVAAQEISSMLIEAEKGNIISSKESTKMRKILEKFKDYSK